jgi:2-polyprenyl-3-methyl-5-hydroxy-6-metoxy-1,4-benzoquinol methylase
MLREVAMKKAWYTHETRTSNELTPYAWAQGFFHTSHDNWDDKTWVRNFHELRCRDLALFTLGEIEGKRVLDIGCGEGVYLLTMAKMGAFVSGQDISPESVERADNLLKQEGFYGDLKVGNAVHLLFPDNHFDSVFSADFFEHITFEQKQQVIAEVYRVLKPGGTFTIKTPNLSYLRLSIAIKRVLAVLRLKSPRIYVAHTRNNPDNEHHGLTTYKELERLLDQEFFHTSHVTYVPLIRRDLPRFITGFLYGKKTFTEHIIITTRKSLFCGFY